MAKIKSKLFSVYCALVLPIQANWNYHNEWQHSRQMCKSLGFLGMVPIYDIKTRLWSAQDVYRCGLASEFNL